MDVTFPTPLIKLAQLHGLKVEHYEDILPEIEGHNDDQIIQLSMQLLKELFAVDNSWIVKLVCESATPYVTIALKDPMFEVCFKVLAESTTTIPQFVLNPHHMNNAFLSVVTKVIAVFPQYKILVEFDGHMTDITIDQFLLFKELQKHCPSIRATVING